jgi:hypothetical protein
MSSNPQIKVTVTDLNSQRISIHIYPSTTIENVRDIFAYGDYITLYSSAGHKLDGNLWAHGLREGDVLWFRMFYTVTPIV